MTIKEKVTALIGVSASRNSDLIDISNHFIDGYSANTLQMLQEHRHIKTI